MDDVDRPGQVSFKPVEEELADKLIQQLSVERFDPHQYHDEYRDRVLTAVDQKVAGQEVTVTPEQPQAQIIDLFEALKRSLGEKGGKVASVTEGKEIPESALEDDKAKPIKKAPARAKAREKKPATG